MQMCIGGIFRKRGDKMDMESLMAQASELQTRVAAAQDALEKTSIKGISGNGACIIELSGKYDLLNLTLRADVTKLDANAIAKLFSDAYIDAKRKADAKIDQVMGAAASGMNLPI